MPPQPKPANLRQRTNKSPSRATLSALTVGRKRAPSLPDRGNDEAGNPIEWHPRTRDMWKRVWHSPMASEYLEADLDGLFQLAELTDQFWRDPTAQRAAEIRLQRQCFGLTPLDRRRLEWSVEQVEQVKERRQRQQPVRPSLSAEDDPRKLFSVV